MALPDDEIHLWALPYRRAQGRAPLRMVLARYLDTVPESITLTTGAHGRPALAPGIDATLDGNWSHSGDRALIAVARGITPGVDLERIRPRPHALPLAERFFPREEYALLAALPAEEQERAFLKLWTGKEAVLKALGHGISFGLDRLSIALEADALRLTRLEGENVHDWQLMTPDLGAGWLAALAWRGAPRKLRFLTLADHS